ncbi:alpha/beta hydrolase [Actinoplanes sp. NEAU-A12]|uniref:Alpha/beta hydrolase n=1 Tax=Actinoplanes sandaracinus TaxID=3045177 RepID=A0ABT6WS63_9ACTN|nr:alpha/beta hydrolase [Actinoplanes sandaracinus]MDI6102587.1 alpha/beta hydrolase [Actinoplanes sandaracinus]
MSSSQPPDPVIDAIVAEPPGHRPLTLDLFRPPAGAAPHPLVIWVHGGGWRTGSNKHDGPQLAPARIGDRILAAGYALARVSYRLSGEATFPAQLHDVKAAVRWLRQHSAGLRLDQARFAVWGESAGGHLAALVALTGDDPSMAGGGAVPGVSDAVRAGVLWYAPSDLLTMAAQNHPEGLQDHDAPESPESRLVGGPVQELPKESAAASPVNYVSPDAPPLLIAHGEQDRIVPVGQSRELHERLIAVGAPAELRIVPGADHCFVGADLVPLVDEGLTFLDRALDR